MTRNDPTQPKISGVGQRNEKNEVLTHLYFRYRWCKLEVWVKAHLQNDEWESSGQSYSIFFILSLTAMYWSMEICASWCMAAIHSPDLWGLLHIVKVIHCKHISCGPERNDTMTKLVIFHSFMLIIAVPFRIHPCCIIHPIPSGDAFCYRTTSALLTCRTTSLGLPS